MYSMILALIGIGISIAYFLLFPVFRLFFPGNAGLPPVRRIVFSVLQIMLITAVTFWISFLPSDPEIGNRLLHGLGGGLTAFFVCFRVVKDGAFQISRLQFFVFGFLVVTAMGVGNEILEFGLQEYVDITLARAIEDTWLDLISNTAGTLVAGALLTPFIRNHIDADT